jgi:hypothetical protein
MGDAQASEARAGLAVALCAVVFVGCAAHLASVQTVTVDEYAHVPAGVATVAFGRVDLYGKNPPLLKRLFAVVVLDEETVVPAPPAQSHGWAPWAYGQAFERANAARYDALFFRARLIVILLGLLGALSLFMWTRPRTDSSTAAALAALWLLNPSVVAHSALATLDVGAAVTILWAALALAWWVDKGGLGRAAVVGVLWGAALLTKFTAALLLPAVLIAFALRRERATVGAFVVVLVSSTLVVHAGYGFAGAFASLGELPVQSSLFSSLKGPLGWLPLPLPAGYTLGFDAQLLDTEQGEFGAYFLGEVSEGGFALYDVVIFLVKTPLPVLAVAAAAWWGHRRHPLPTGEARALTACAGALALFLLFFNKLDLGVRYLLPLLPLLLVLGAGAVHHALERQPLAGPVVGGVMAVSLLASHPDELRWFNLAAAGQGEVIAADSNVDWGQDLYRLPSVLRELGRPDDEIALLYFGHVDPARYGLRHRLPRGPGEHGLVVVSHQFRVGLPYLAPSPGGHMTAVRPGQVAWLDAHAPIARAGALWVYDLGPAPSAAAPAPPPPEAEPGADLSPPRGP